jgi:hypothetical protein
MHIINLDKSLEAALSFVENRGFSEILSQFEMVKPLR